MDLARFRAALDALGVPADAALGVAVSGGPDSLALLLLAAADRPGKVRAATVDHGLRPEARAEAEHVARLCAEIGVPHAILAPAAVAGARHGSQAWARAARYAALADWCADHALPFLATAHHADDQAETLLMRLARGSGVGGLSGVRPVRALGRATLVRPLLGYDKADLTAIVASAGWRAIDDPSNADSHFDRTRARALLAETAWLDARRLADAAAHLREADAALDWAADRTLAEHARKDGDAWRLDPADPPPELVRRVTARLIERLTGQTPRGPELQRFIARLRRGQTATLAGVIGRAKDGVWRLELAPPRRRGT